LLIFLMKLRIWSYRNTMIRTSKSNNHCILSFFAAKIMIFREILGWVVAIPLYLPECTSKTEMSAGVTPLILLAWPMVIGLI